MPNIKDLVTERNSLENDIKTRAKTLRTLRKRKTELDAIIAKYMETNNLPGLKCEFENSKKNAIITKNVKRRRYVKKDIRMKQCKQLLKDCGIPQSARDSLLHNLLETAKGPIVLEKTITSKRLK